MKIKIVLFKTALFVTVFIAVLIVGTEDTHAQVNQIEVAVTKRPSEIEPITETSEMQLIEKPGLREFTNGSSEPMKILNLLAYGGVAQMQYKFGGEPGGQDLDLDDSNSVFVMRSSGSTDSASSTGLFSQSFPASMTSRGASFPTR